MPLEPFAVGVVGSDVWFTYRSAGMLSVQFVTNAGPLNRCGASF